MIQPDSLAQVGKVNKTHGVNGELSISIYEPDLEPAMQPGLCLLFSLDGIFTPFFAKSVRPRSSEAWLVAFDGLESQEEASFLVGRDVYIPIDMLPDTQDVDDDEDEEGFYASDLIGYQAETAEGQQLGTIIDIDDSTANALFIIRDAHDQIIYIPIADEFISKISDTNRKLIFELPEGLLSI